MRVHVVVAWQDVLDDEPLPHLWHGAFPTTTPVSDVYRAFLSGDEQVADSEATDGPWSLTRLADYAQTETLASELFVLTADPVPAVFDPEDLVGGRYGPGGLLEPSLADVMRFRRPPLKGARS